MKIEIVLPYPGLPTAKVTIPDAHDDKEQAEDVTGNDADDTGDDTGDDASHSDTGDEQAQ